MVLYKGIDPAQDEGSLIPQISGETENGTEDSGENASVFILNEAIPELRAVHVECRIGWVIVVHPGCIDRCPKVLWMVL